MRDYNFWVYIMTNDHDTVLYTGEIPGFTADFRCRKLLYYEHCTDVLGYNRAGKAAQELVEEEEDSVDRNDEPAVERPGARSPRR